MSTMIIDGTGKGHRLRVLEDNSILTTAIAKTEMVATSENAQQAYIFANGGFPSITSLATESAILHVQNTSVDQYLHIFSIRSCGTNITKWRAYKNITGGTIISGGVPGLDNNLNLASANTCDCITYSGGDSVTYTGGTMFEHWINDTGHSVENFEGAIILGSEDSLTLTVEVDTAATVCCRMIGYYRSM